MENNIIAYVLQGKWKIQCDENHIFKIQIVDHEEYDTWRDMMWLNVIKLFGAYAIM